jgi:hypothetical protein
MSVQDECFSKVKLKALEIYFLAIQKIGAIAIGIQTTTRKLVAD